MSEVRYQDYFGNEDATPERLKRAKEAGFQTPIVDIYLPSGMPSGARRRHIERPLDTALRHEWIDELQKLAGEDFLRHMVAARMQIKFTSSAWSLPVDGGNAGDPFLSKQFHQAAYRRALHAIRHDMREPFQDWIIKSEQTDTSILELGEKFTEDKNRDSLRTAGKLSLRIILNDLAVHFGYISRPSGWQTRQQLESLLKRNQQAFER